MGRHHLNGRGLTVARSTPKQITPPIRKIVLSKPVFPLEEKFKVAPHHAAGIRIHHDRIPIISSLQARSSVYGFETSPCLILYLLQNQENSCGVVSVHDEPVVS